MWLEDKQIVGIFTERDVVKRVLAQNLNSQTTPVAEVMSSHVVCIDIDTDVEEAYKKMKDEACRHLPVLENAEVAGIISIRNLMDLMLQQLRYERDLLKQYVEN